MARTTTLSSIEEQQHFITKVYAWMCGALALTGVTAYYFSLQQKIMNAIFGNWLYFWGIVIIELALVWKLASSIDKMSVQAATGTFLLYSAINGLTMSVIFQVFTTASIAVTFGATSLMFGIMSFVGFVTKKDLTGLGGFLFMGLIGIIIATIINMFVFNGIFYWVTTFLGILIFIGLTAYDTQKIKELNILGNEGTDEDTKEAIHGALTLYLDFINLFLQLLRIFGKRK